MKVVIYSPDTYVIRQYLYSLMAKEKPLWFPIKKNVYNGTEKVHFSIADYKMNFKIGEDIVDIYMNYTICNASKDFIDAIIKLLKRYTLYKEVNKI